MLFRSAPSGNGNALALSDLAHAPLVDNLSPSQFICSLAGRVGSALGNSRSDEKTQGLLLAQARNQRAKGSEVSLDEEAASLVAFQKQYEANSELFRILSSLTETTLNLVR